jgi:hypothetical protein
MLRVRARCNNTTAWLDPVPFTTAIRFHAVVMAPSQALPGFRAGVETQYSLHRGASPYSRLNGTAYYPREACCVFV